MHDGIELEKLGTPTAVICTEPFISSGKAMSRIGGIADYPFAIVGHPVARLAPDALRERAMQAAAQVLEILLAKGRR